MPFFDYFELLVAAPMGFGTMSSYEKALNLVILNEQADSKADRQTDQPTGLIDV